MSYNVYMRANEIDTMTAAYATCALWSSIDWDTEEPMDAEYGLDDLAESTLMGFALDCAAFYEDNHFDLEDMNAEQAGHDFWLTRNHHGAGFWDRGLGERGDRLTAACRPYGSVDLYAMNGKVYAE